MSTYVSVLNNAHKCSDLPIDLKAALVAIAIPTYVDRGFSCGVVNLWGRLRQHLERAWILTCRPLRWNPTYPGETT